MFSTVSKLWQPRDIGDKRFYLTCKGCQMIRLTPQGLRFGQKFQLKTCPRCGQAGPTARYFNSFIWGL